MGVNIKMECLSLMNVREFSFGLKQPNKSIINYKKMVKKDLKIDVETRQVLRTYHKTLVLGPEKKLQWNLALSPCLQRKIPCLGQYLKVPIFSNFPLKTFRNIRKISKFQKKFKFPFKYL